MDKLNSTFQSPFYRPNAHLMAASASGAAPPAAPGNKGLKGIIAGSNTDNY